MDQPITASAEVTINAPADRVWDALVNPELVRQYLNGAEVVSDWTQGSPITFRGEWEGDFYEDKGLILDIEPPYLLRVTHYSPLSEMPDEPENYHIVTYTLSDNGGQTTLNITQENNQDQEEADESAETWSAILGNMKALIEQ